MQVQVPETDVATAGPDRRRSLGWGVAAWLIALVPTVAGTVAGGDLDSGALAEAGVLSGILALVTAAVFGITLHRRLDPEVEPSHRSRTALSLAIGALASVVAFWSGSQAIVQAREAGLRGS